MKGRNERQKKFEKKILTRRDGLDIVPILLHTLGRKNWSLKTE